MSSAGPPLLCHAETRAAPLGDSAEGGGALNRFRLFAHGEASHGDALRSSSKCELCRRDPESHWTPGCTGSYLPSLPDRGLIQESGNRRSAR